ncbi:MAG: iron-sulfur cluster repair di-iron protein [Dysgonamonadaceae bacterium]|nr:iron-sulfur cluster repair di-iron protein [Dysgonamonadaceae bacterium]MDD4727737.1 iron-sulfur cluster repair di-iron protein [Dysgonamonadaceae bacterium]
MEVQKNQIIGELVAKDYRAASVFKKYNIDFCCQGNRTINDACTEKKLDVVMVLNDLNAIGNTSNSAGIDFKSWPLDLLADYIEKTHHRYVEDKSPELIAYLKKICEVHGKNHTELFEIKELMQQTIGNLAQHMKKEELILFPYITKMEKAKRTGELLKKPNFDSIQNPIIEMESEHSAEGDRFRDIETLSNNYTPPEDACNTYRVTFAMLKEFQDDLHLHIHLENNILFPKSILLEKQLL